jgi:hypothetical protein
MAKFERRRNERYPIGPGFTAQLVGVDIPVTLVNIGVGGFALASDRLMPSATRVEARFADTGQAWSVSLNARIAYSVSQPCSEGEYRGKYITGFAFVDADVPSVKRRIQDFITRVMLDVVSA